ncbi:MAG: T9SS type A sorting domain-containing protein [Melioribacteraceae bacterium]
MKKFLLLIFVLSFSVSYAQTVLLNENFSYNPGQLTDASGGANVGGGNWITNTGTGNYLQVSAGSLSYAGYPSSNINNKLNLVGATTSSEDTYRAFTTQITGNVYASFLLNVTNTTGLTATGDYFIALLPSASTSFYAGRVYIQTGTTPGTQFRLGLRYNSSDAAVNYSTTDLNIGTSYLIVLKYQIVSGAPNDIVSLFINPAMSGTEPLANLTATSSSATTENADVGKFGIRQGNAGTPNASIDGIRVADNWGLAVTGTATAVEENNPVVPTSYSLSQNYPNPFNPETVISYQLSANSHVSLKVYDVLGREVATLVNEYQQPGLYNSKFSINNLPAGRQGSQFGSGVYFYRIQASDFTQTKKMILMK